MLIVVTVTRIDAVCYGDGDDGGDGEQLIFTTFGTSAADACASLVCAWWMGEQSSEWVVMVVTVIRIGGGGNGGGDHVINSYSPRLALQQQMLVHRFFLPDG